MSPSRVFLGLLVLMIAAPSFAQDDRRVYAGAVFGVATLSADGRSITDAPSAMISLYKPENGPALNLFTGWHFSRFLTVQGNYVWNRNDVALLSSTLSPAGSGFYEQPRSSRQHSAVGDLLLYFRARGSGVRPYLSTGVALTRFTSTQIGPAVESGLMAPAGNITATNIGVRVAVGIDLAMGRWAFRYSFSETISGNPISGALMPKGQRGLANFQNLFGFTYALPR